MYRANVASPFTEKMADTVRSLSRMNFYLWLYVAREGDYDDALDFIRIMRDVPAPFEECYPLSTSSVFDHPFPCSDDF